MRSLVAPLVLLAGCGRFGFDGVTATADAADGALSPKARSHLMIDRFLPTTPLANFPLPIVLDTTRADHALLTPATFRAFAGSTELDVDVETGNGENPFVAWVRVPQIETTPIELTIEYGGSPGTLHDVWDDSYLLVMHANGDAHDSSRYARPTNASNVSNAPGQLGGAGLFDPAQNSYVVVPSLANYAFTTITLSAWMRMRVSSGPGYYSAITRQLGDDSFADDFMLANEPGEFPYGHITTVPTPPVELNGPVMLPLTQWLRLAYTYDGANQTLWVGSGMQVSSSGTGTPTTSGRPVFVGAGRNMAITSIDVPDQDFMDGELDEIRIENTARSSVWTIFEAIAQNDGVITYGAVEHL